MAQMKPQRMDIQFAAIPIDIVKQDNWIVWRWEKRSGKWTKPPYQASEAPAKSNDPKTWVSYLSIVEAYKTGKWDGIGFMLNGAHVGIDWDDIRDSQSGEIAEDYLKKIRFINSYTEISPSGNGVKTLVIGKLPAGGHHNKNVGVFSSGRYFCITGNVLNGCSPFIEPRQKELNALVKHYWPQDFEEKPAQSPPPTTQETPVNIIQKALNSNDDKFNRLWSGDFSEYASQSEGDQALCYKLAFWTGKNYAAIDALFRVSGLMRDKWNRADYRERTISAAISGTAEVYHAKHKRSSPSRESGESAHKGSPDTGPRPGAAKPPSRIDISNVFDAKKMVVAYEEYLKSLKENRFYLGIPEIDKRIRGIAGGEVLTIIARSGSFKTAMLQNLLKNYVQNSAWVAVFFSLEMPVASVAERYFQILDGVTGAEVESMFTNPSRASEKNTAIGEFVRDMNRFYVIPTRVSLNDIASYVRLIEAEKNVKVGVIGIDYLGLLDGPGFNRYEITTKLATDTKLVAKELNIPVILLSQVGRKGGSGQAEITLDMGRDSGAIEEGADVVLGLWQHRREPDEWMDDDDPRFDLICKILKNRKGRKDSVWKLELVAHAMQIGANALPFISDDNSTNTGTGY